MTVAALDLGKARVGLAVSDDLGILAHPRPALDGRNTKALLAHLSSLIHEEQVQRIVIGLPLDQFGMEGPAARSARNLSERIERELRIPVELFDERFTTVEAQRRLREGGLSVKQSRKRIDSAAACVLLQAWLEAHREPSA